MSLADFELIKKLGKLTIQDFKWLPIFSNYANQNSSKGEGAYSSVYQVKRILDNTIYALKKVKMENLSDKEKENALNEVRILASVQHQNISSFKEAFIDERSSSLW